MKSAKPDEVAPILASEKILGHNMFQFTILQTADIHGKLENLTRLATLANQIRANHPRTAIVHLDAGDAQDREHPLNAKTNGVAAYRLLKTMGCDVSVMSNKSMKRYGPGVLVDYSATGVPILVGNLVTPDKKQFSGTQPSMIIDIEDFKLGVIGVTAYQSGYIERHNLYPVDFIERIRQELATLKTQGADATIILSHMGIWDDDRIAHIFQDEIKLIVGGHSHSFFPNGKIRNGVSISHIGAYAHYLGKIDLTWDGENLQIDHIEALPVRSNLPQHPALLAEMDAIEAELS